MNSHSGTDITAVELLDGRVVSLRRLGGQDSDAVLALHKHLPDQDRSLNRWAAGARLPPCQDRASRFIHTGFARDNPAIAFPGSASCLPS